MFFEVNNDFPRLKSQVHLFSVHVGAKPLFSEQGAVYFVKQL